MSNQEAARPASRRPSKYRDKAELRATVHEAVQEFTHLRRDKLRRDYVREHPDATELEIVEFLDERQPQYDEFDPVVQLAVMSSDHSHDPKIRRQAMADAAPYLRPKLKQIEHLEDPEHLSLMDRKTDIAQNLMNLLVVAAAGRSSATRGGSSPDRPDDSGRNPDHPKPYEDDGDEDSVDEVYEDPEDEDDY